MAFNPATDSLYISGEHDKVAEVTIPVPRQSSDVNALPYATLLQPFADPAEGHIATDMQGAGLTGLMVYENRLYGTATIWYDANNTQRVSHFSRSLQLNQPSFSGWSSVWQADRSGYVSGFMATVPSEWQSRLGGLALTGQCCVSIAWRTSNGPAAFAFDPAAVGTPLVSVTPLLYYTITPGYDTLGPWEGSNPTYGATTYIRGMAVIAGTRTALYFGNNGMGAYCYGNGTADQSLAGIVGPDGARWCYDPTESGKGQHAYPYRYQVWAYDLNDLAAVKAGTKQPWEVRPYGVWPLTLPTPAARVSLGGVAYDAVRQIVYVAQLSADNNNRIIAEAPIIHAFRLSAPGVTGATNPVSSTTDAADAPVPASTLASSVAVVADKAAPQVANTTITFTATRSGSTAPYLYKWFVSDGSTWTTVGGWTSSQSFTWTPGVANANHRIRVWIKASVNTADQAEVSVEQGFAITAPAPPAPALISSVALVADKAAPQVAKTTITFTATPSGGTTPALYKWAVWEGSTWTTVGVWTSSQKFTWMPDLANPNYRIRVWVKSSVNTADQPEAAVEQAFSIIWGH